MERCAVFVYFFVNVQPSPLLGRIKSFHDFFQITDHFLPDSFNKTTPLGGGVHNDFPAIRFVGRAFDVTEFFKPLDQSRGGRHAVIHECGDASHSQGAMSAKVS